MTVPPEKPGEPCAAGWDAIATALDRIYPGQEPRHWGTLLGFRLGGPDPLDGVSAYRHDDGKNAAHWHYVSFGMSELYAKESADPRVSGWGFEFSFRLVTEEDDAPVWPAGMMQNLARYVIRSGNSFSVGHYLPMNGPIAQGRQTAIQAGLFADDPELPTICTPNGTVRPLLLVGLTLDELAAVRAWSAERMTALMRDRNPLLVTDLARQTILQDGATARRVAEGAAREGSSSGSLFVPTLGIEIQREAIRRSLVVTLGAHVVEDFRSLLRGRTGFERPFAVVSPNASMSIAPAGEFKWETDDAQNRVAVHVPLLAARALADMLRPTRGEYEIPELTNLIIRVTPSEIRDHTGTSVIKVIE